MSPLTPTTQLPLIIVGSGAAGLYAALVAASEREVLVLSKGPLQSSASYLAQGGVAAAIGADDSPELHIADTLAAGRGLCRESAVRALCEEAPARIADLVELGVPFDEGLGLEGGHSRRRVSHAAGAATGAAIEQALAARVREHPRITVHEGESVRELLLDVNGRCRGVVTESNRYLGSAVLLATGGYAALWSRTSNPAGSTGDGLLLAWQVGAALADLEFVQFHPTTLAGHGLLLSEALRGEGALLLDAAGQRFTDELAPRDVVSRAIDARGSALLDLRPIAQDHFPSLMTALLDHGFDPAQPIPVAPAAHYTMGGIVTDLAGQTSVPGLYAAGECACTGVQGANRLASNSLLECLVFGRRAALAALAAPALVAVPLSVPTPAARPELTVELREALWHHCGLIRERAGLEQLLDAPHPLIGLIAQSALAREESRGGHFRADFPTEATEYAKHTVLYNTGLYPGQAPTFEVWS